MTLPAICLMGPTAAGKTRLALELHRRLPCEIISVDSAMVYRGLDIGTAKPGPEILSEAPHHLIDVCSPREAYSAGRFQDDAGVKLARIRAAGRIPLLVGGSGLYFRALERGLSRLPDPDLQVRAGLDREAAECGWPGLHRRLAEVDPAAAARIHPHDSRRIQRALEVWQLCGRALSDCWAQEPPAPLLLDAVRLVLAPAERAQLHRNIHARFQAMLRQGLIEEVRSLRARHELPTDRPAARLVGYRQVLAYLDGATDRSTMVARALAATRGLARRQLTWLRAEREPAWFDGSGAPGRVRARVLQYLAGNATLAGLLD